MRLVLFLCLTIRICRKTGYIVFEKILEEVYGLSYKLVLAPNKKATVFHIRFKGTEMKFVRHRFQHERKHLADACPDEIAHIVDGEVHMASDANRSCIRTEPVFYVITYRRPHGNNNILARQVFRMDAGQFG